MSERTEEKNRCRERKITEALGQQNKNKKAD